MDEELENYINEGEKIDTSNTGAEDDSIDSVDKAGDKSPKAKKRKGDKGTQDPKPKANNVSMISTAVSKMKEMNNKQLSTMLANMESTNDFTTEAEDINYERDFSKDFDELVSEDENLSEDFKSKASVIFENAFKSRLAEEVDKLNRKFNESVEKAADYQREELYEQVDNYLNYFIEKWTKEHSNVIESNIRSHIHLEFMDSMKEVFEQYNINVPEGKEDVVEGLVEQVNELEKEVNSKTENEISMIGELDNLKREKIIREAGEGLADTEIDKLQELAEDIDSSNIDKFENKVIKLKETYFSGKNTKSIYLNNDEEVEQDENDESLTDNMSKYLNVTRQLETN